MWIDWDSFTPWSSLIGGVIIGIASAILVLFNGRIAGISGILAGLIQPLEGRGGWRICFVAGLGLSAVMWWLATGAPPGGAPVAGLPVSIVAGLFVGVGTRVGGGCTSGHGVCGLSRLSFRSLVATLTFMAAGIVTAVIRGALDGA